MGCKISIEAHSSSSPSQFEAHLQPIRKKRRQKTKNHVHSSTNKMSIDMIKHSINHKREKKLRVVQLKYPLDQVTIKAKEFGKFINFDHLDMNDINQIPKSIGVGESSQSQLPSKQKKKRIEFLSVLPVKRDKTVSATNACFKRFSRFTGIEKPLENLNRLFKNCQNRDGSIPSRNISTRKRIVSFIDSLSKNAETEIKEPPTEKSLLPVSSSYSRNLIPAFRPSIFGGTLLQNKGKPTRSPSTPFSVKSNFYTNQKNCTRVQRGVNISCRLKC